MAPPEPPQVERGTMAEAALVSRGESSFEIRKGKRSSDENQALPESVAPAGPVILPQSITQEEEAADLRRAFGVDSLPQIDRQHGSVQLAKSAGATGPDRKRLGLKLTLAVLALVAIGGYVAYTQGMLDSFLKG